LQILPGSRKLSAEEATQQEVRSNAEKIIGSDASSASAIYTRLSTRQDEVNRGPEEHVHDSEVGEHRETTEVGKPRRGIFGSRARVLVLILVTQALMVLWVTDSEMARGIYLICYSLMMPTVLYLLIARVLRRWLPFDDKELLLGYIVLTATLPIIGCGGLRFIVVGNGFLTHFARNQAQWAQYVPFLKHLPVLHDPYAASGIYVGGNTVPWRAWIAPIAFWSTYLLALSGIWLCLAAVLRRVWVRQERLSFPVTMLPLRVMDPKDDIFRRRIFWLGFVVPVVLQSLLVIHQWAPSVPAFQLKAFDAAPLIFTSPPWNAIPDFQISFQPLAIGLAFFVPSDVSFSCWFLSLAIKGVYVVSSMYGVQATDMGASRFPYREEQAAGAWFAFACLIAWSARGHIRATVKMVAEEEHRFVTKMIVTAGALAGLCAVMMWATGIPMIAATGIILVYIAYVLTGARVRAEAGAQWTFAPTSWTPNRVMTSLLGTQGAGNQALVASGHFDLVHIDIRGQSLPYLMEGLNVAERTGIPWRTVLAWVALGTVTALAMGWWHSLTKLYELGASTAKMDQYAMRKVNACFTEVNRLASTGGKAWDADGIKGMVGGAVITVLFAKLRAIGIWAPHPVGYVMCNTYTMKAFMVPFFLAWSIKTLLLRFGGNTIYRRSVPLFVGVILGDIVTQAMWSLVGWVFNVPIYQFVT